MKFRDKDMFDNILAAYRAFCRDRECEGCPLRGKKTRLGCCDEWAVENPSEAAALMGYEIIEEDATPGQEAKSDANTRKHFLHEAERCICNNREEEYGTPENSFKAIASLWEPYIRIKCTSPGADVTINPEDVGVMMALFKIGRIATGSFKADSYIDGIGYLACAGEIAGGSK